MLLHIAEVCKCPQERWTSGSTSVTRVADPQTAVNEPDEQPPPDRRGATSRASGDGAANMIGAIDNVLRLLRLFESHELLRVNEVSRQMSLSRSTVHRMLATLLHHGFVVQDEFSRGYGPGPALVDIGLAAVHQMDIRTTARPSLEALRRATGETVHLAVLRATDVLYLDGLESERLVRAGQRIGQTLPAYATAAGKALLAEMDDDAVRALYPEGDLAPVTAHSLRTRSALLDVLQTVRAHGYAVNHGESEDDISALAGAVRDRRSRVRAALVVTAPRSRADEAWTSRVREAMLEATAALGNRLG